MINNILKKGWSIFRQSYVTLIISTIIAALMMLLVVTIPPMIFGLFYVAIQLAKGKSVRAKDVFKGFDHFLRSWGLTLLMLLAVGLGLVLLVIPGLLLLILYQFAFAISLLEDRKAYDSLKRSYELVKKNFSFSLVFFVIMMVISAIGGLTRFGVFLTVPFTMVCSVLAAMELVKKK